MIRRAIPLVALLLGTIALGVLSRVVLACWVSRYPELYTMDDPYQDMAWSLLEGRGLSRPSDPWPVALWPPGYPLFLAGIFAYLFDLLCYILGQHSSFYLFSISFTRSEKGLDAVVNVILAVDAGGDHIFVITKLVVNHIDEIPAAVRAGHLAIAEHVDPRQ